MMLSVVDEILFIDDIKKSIGYTNTINSSDPINNFLNIIQLLNRLGLLDINSHNEFDEKFDETISDIFIKKESNIILKKINLFNLKDIIKITGNESINTETLGEIKHKIYKQIILNLFAELSINLEKIAFKYSLKNLSKILESRESILVDSKITLVSSLIFNHDQWKEIVLREILLANSIEEMKLARDKFLSSLELLYSTLPVENIPVNYINNSFFIAECWVEHENIFVYPLSSSIIYKRAYLDSLNNNSLIKLFEANLKKLNIEKKNRKIELERKLRERKIELKSKKHYASILNGMQYLLKKQNPNISTIGINRISKRIIYNLFYITKNQPNNEVIAFEVNIDKTILLEYLYFLSKEDKYFKKLKISLPKVVNENLSYNSKGFSYKNLNRVLKTILSQEKLTFGGLTSISVLRNEMKMRK